MSTGDKLQLWGGRFESGPSATFESFSGSLHFDKRLADCDIRGSQAFARALQRVGILTTDEWAALVAAFDEMRVEAREPAFYEGATDEDVHTLIIRKLKGKVASASRYDLSHEALSLLSSMRQVCPGCLEYLTHSADSLI